MYQLVLTISTLLYGGLFGDLASPDFRVREQASVAIRQVGYLAWPALYEASKSQDVEKARRAEEVWYSKTKLSNHTKNMLGVTYILGRQGTQYPTDAEMAWLWEKDGRLDLFATFCKQLGLQNAKTEEAPLFGFMGWMSDGAGYVAIMRGRAAKRPLPYPDDPQGPKP